MSNFDFIRLLEVIDNNKILASPEWNRFKEAVPTMANDLKSILQRHDYERFLEVSKELFTANKNNKTGALFPKLSADAWKALMQVIQYMLKEQPQLKRKEAAKTHDPIWNADTMATTDRIREELQRLSEAIADYLSTTI